MSEEESEDTVVVGLISNNTETAYLQEIRNLKNWCQENNLLINVRKTKELIMDFSKRQVRNYQFLYIRGITGEREDSFQYLGVHITQNLSWTCHITTLEKMACQWLFFLKRHWDFNLTRRVIKNIYICTIESILTGDICTSFGNSTQQDRQDLHGVVSFLTYSAFTPSSVKVKPER